MAKTDAEILDELEEQFLEFYRTAWAHDHCQLTKLCQSPIEILMGAALIAFEPDTMRLRHWPDGASYESPPRRFFNSYERAVFFPQVPVDRFRVDFLLLAHTEPGHVARLVIECDGHDYHERTKAQAKKDKQRDRFMTARGLTVARFTGSEIFADANKCAEEVWSMVWNAQTIQMGEW